MLLKAYEKCNGKNCYSKSQAEKVSHAVMRARNRKIRIYECPDCYMWHLTSEHFKFK